MFEIYTNPNGKHLINKSCLKGFGFEGFKLFIVTFKSFPKRSWNFYFCKTLTLAKLDKKL